MPQEEVWKEMSSGQHLTEAEKSRIGSPVETYGIYVCPTCKQELELRGGALWCRVCAVTYLILDGIPFSKDN